MLQSIWDDIRREFDYGNMVNRIIIVNVAVFLVINLTWVVLRLLNHFETPGFYADFVHFFAISNSGWHMLTHPWSVLTHMFVHEGFWHVFWNMIMLFWFGRIFGDLLGDRRVLPLYILGGLAGALFFFAGAALPGFPGGEGVVYAIGASAAVLCILVATGMFAPDYNIRLLLLGNVRLKYIVAFFVFMNIISLGSDINTGGAFGHMGGILMGFLFTWYLRRGTDLTDPVRGGIDGVKGLYRGMLRPSKDHGPRPGPRAAFRGGKSVKETATRESGRTNFMRRSGGTGGKRNGGNKSGELNHQEQLDAILDKIKDKGYNSLDKDEKEFLFRASNRN